MNNIQLITRYALLAVVAMTANLATQRLFLAWVSGQAGFVLALIAGTGVGLVLKYVLDKKFIFLDATRSVGDETRKFSLYTLTGIGTTLIFWGSETLFWLVWQTDFMREIGAVLGLTVGYVIKYQLDRRYVFGAASN